MNTITFIKGSGGVPKTLPGEDHISGLLMYIPNTDLPTPDQGITGGFTTTQRIHAISTIELAESYGIKSTSSNWLIRALHFQLSTCFGINPSISLYVGMFEQPQSYDFLEVKIMQNFAQGKLRQVLVYCPQLAIDGAHITALQTNVASVLEAQYMPLQILYAPKVGNISNLTDLSGTGKKNVSVIIGQPGSGTGADLYLHADNTANKNSVSIGGIVLGMVSKAAVHESIAWVGKFPSGVDVPAFGDGTLVKNVDQAVLEALDTKRFLFLVYHGGLTGSYMNDSHTMDLVTSDYAMIEHNRTMDKAIRGIRTYLLPYLSSPLYVDPATGKLKQDTVTFLELLAGYQLENMEKAGELSGYKVEVDANQNVLTSSEVEFVIKQVEVGVMRKMKIKIGFTTKLN